MMKKNLTWFSFLFAFLTITGLAVGSDEKTIYLHCQGDDWDYQVSIIGQPGQQSVRYKLQDINSHPSFGYQEGVLTEYSITDDLIAYTENKDEYLVSRVDGTFTRNREILPINCIETDYDMVAALEAAEAAEQERQQKAEAEWEQYWSDYQSRQKTLMEEVYNFADTGYPEGLDYSHWVEIEECILTNGNLTVDNREINMTAFRMYPEFIDSAWYMVSTDMNYIRLVTSASIPMDRLQKAWSLAFEQCPGKQSNF